VKSLRDIIDFIKFWGTLATWFVIYKNLYSSLGFFLTRRFKKAKNNHKYAVLIAARNESTVIGNLIESIRQQDYPSELVTIFVVADNCTDNTAEVARKAGAIVYERFDDAHRTKGYALQFLVRNIEADYGVKSFEGYFFFDADNLLKRDFISRMNDSFDAGEKIVTSFRNTKNFATNWISSSYAIHWYRTVRNEHRARSFLRLATRIQGTGFLVANEILKDGWNYVSLTEDRELSAFAATNGYSISYNDAAEFYDEQPVDVKIMMRQRIRWAKGHLWAFTHYGWVLFKNIFTHKTQNNQTRPKSLIGRFFNYIQRSFICYDMFWTVFPRGLTAFFRRFVLIFLRLAILVKAGADGWDLFDPFLIYLSTISGHMQGAIFTAIYVLGLEYRRVPKCKPLRMLWYCVTFSLFDKIGMVSTIIALFKKVEWKPIPHIDNKSLADMERDLGQSA